MNKADLIGHDFQSAVVEVPRLVRQLYETVSELERLFNRKFTPDGHLVGSLGEVLAAHMYDLRLCPASNMGHDAEAANGALVEIKATQGKSVALRSEPQHLLVLLLSKHGTAEEVFNGPGSLAWAACGSRQKNGQSQVSLTKLRRAMAEVPSSARLPLIRDLAAL